MDFYEEVMKNMRVNPLNFLPPICHGLSVLFSLYAIFVSVRCNKITNWKIRGITTFTLCWNVFSQIFIYVLYGFFLGPKAYGAMWLLMNGVMTCLVYTDLMILECFQSLLDWVTPKVLTRMKYGVLALYCAFNTFIFLRLFIDAFEPYNYAEMLCGITYIGLCVVYDNFQAFYLTYVVYNRRGKKNRDQASKALKEAILMNMMVCMVDWIALGVFAFQEQGQQARSLRKYCKDTEITVIERQQEFQYNISLPRGLVDKEFAAKSFIPLNNMVKNGKVVHGSVVSIGSNDVVLESGERVPFDYLVIATGTSYDGIFKVQAKTKEEGLSIISENFEKIKNASNIVLVGGGSAAIELAGEIKGTYPEKQVTIVQSQAKLLNNVFPDSTRDRFATKLEKAGVKVLFNEKVTELQPIKVGSHTVELSSGKKLESDLTISCVGKLIPNTSFLESLGILNDKKEVKVKKTLQVDDERFANVFAMGDCAATGASKTVTHLEAMATTIVNNIQSLVKQGELKDFAPSPKEVIIATIGKTDGTGYIPFMPDVVIDFMARKLKCPDLFLARAAGFYGHKM